MKELAFSLLLLLSLVATAQGKDTSHPAGDEKVESSVRNDTLAASADWQALKKLVAKNPFEHQKQFYIDFSGYTDRDWCYPLRGAKLISPYGGGRNHKGTDLKTVRNDTIRAAFPGEVTLSAPHYGYGLFIVIRHPNGLETAYSHNSKNLVKVGEWVEAGQPIALEGTTGRVTTHHLHFEVRINGQQFDSSRIIDHAKHDLRRQKFIFTKQGGTVKITTEE